MTISLAASRRLFFLKSWIVLLIARLVALAAHKVLPSKPQLSNAEYIVAIAASPHHFALALLWVKNNACDHKFKAIIRLNGNIYRLKAGVPCAEITEPYSGSPSSHLVNKNLLAVLELLSSLHSKPFLVKLVHAFGFSSRNLILVPHVSPWLFPNILDLILVSFASLRGNVKYFDDGTTGYLDSAFPRVFNTCPHKSKIFSLSLTAFKSDHLVDNSPSIIEYFEALASISATLPPTAANLDLPNTPSDLIISSKYLSLDLVKSFYEANGHVPSDVSICYAKHPRSWKNNCARVASLFPSSSFVDPGLLELFILERSNFFSRIFIGYSSTAFLLAEMKTLGLLLSDIIVVIDLEVLSKLHNESELLEFLVLVRTVPAISCVLSS